MRLRSTPCSTTTARPRTRNGWSSACWRSVTYPGSAVVNGVSVRGRLPSLLSVGRTRGSAGRDVFELARERSRDVGHAGAVGVEAFSRAALRQPRARAIGCAPGSLPVHDDRLGLDAAMLIDGLGLRQVRFCGLSKGGMVGMWLGANAPHMLNRLVLANTSSSLGPPEFWDERIRVAQADGMAALADVVINRWFTPEFIQRVPGEIDRCRRACSSRRRPTGMRHAARRYATWIWTPRCRGFARPRW